MTSVVTAEFRDRLGWLPVPVRQQAHRAYLLWRSDPHHPGLQFKRVSPRQPVYSARVGLGHRALGLWEGDTVTWFWIGSHAEYDALLARLFGPPLMRSSGIPPLRWQVPIFPSTPGARSHARSGTCRHPR